MLRATKKNKKATKHTSPITKKPLNFCCILFMLSVRQNLNDSCFIEYRLRNKFLITCVVTSTSL